jgi:copper chaperone NosL
MPYIVGFLIGFGILTAIMNRKWILIIYFTLLVGLAIAGLTDFYLWAYDYGHNLDPAAAIQVPGMSYQPPIIGTKQLLNFTAFSGPDVAGWMFLGAGILVLITILAEKFYFKTKAPTE